MDRQVKAIYDCSGKSIPQSECDALVDFYNSTNGDAWVTKTYWFDPDPCTWFGVSCTDLPAPRHVISLKLDNNNVGGVLPASIGDFPEMTRLILHGNLIEGAIPSQIGQLTSLFQLYLEGNLLTGPIPAEIGDMLSMEDLRLNSNLLDGPLPITLGDLPVIEELYLSNNNIGGAIPAELGSLVNLTTLQLMHNSLTGNIPPELGNLGNLTVLTLATNALDGEVPSELGELSNLVTLYLSENSFSGPLPQSLTNLVALDWLSYDTTSVCEPQNGSFQTWLGGVDHVSNTGILPCVAALLFEDDFETGNLDLWTRYNDGKGFLSACEEAAINGTYGACVERGTNDKRKQLIDDTPAYETTFAARFNFDINGLAMSEGERFRFMQFKFDAERPAFIVMKYQGGKYYIQLNTLIDARTKVKSGWHELPDAVRTIEVSWQKSGVGLNNGYAELYIDGVLQETLSGLDNDTLLISSFRMGFTSRLAGKTISGIFYIDDVATSNDVYIGPPFP